MSLYEYSLVACAAFTMALISFPNYAATMGWRHGSLFALPATTLMTYTGPMAVMFLVQVAAAILIGKLTWWWLLIIPSSAMIGGAAITKILGRNSGMFALMAAPVSFLATCVLFFNK